MRFQTNLTAAAVVAVSFYSSIARADESNQRDAARQEAELAVSRRILDKAIVVADGTAKSYDDLSIAHDALIKRLSGLMTNEEGKRLAASLDPILARDAVQNIESPVLDPVALNTNRKQAVALVDQLKKERDNIVPGYVPPEAILSELQSLSSWAASARTNVKLRTEWLEQQVAVTNDKFDAATASTLEQVLADFRRREQEAWKSAREQGIKQAMPEGEAAITEAAKISELEKSLQASDKLLKQSRADLLTQKGEHEAAVARQKEAYEQNMADLRKELAEKKAQRQVQDAGTEAVAKQGNIDAEKVKLLAEAKDPAIQRLLAPLLAKGFTQPGQRERTLEATPVSFRAIQATGALDRSDDGLFMLAKMCSVRMAGKGSTYTNKNWDRPTWGFPNDWRQWTNEQRQQLLKAQDAINRLGPTLVELGMLAD